jgi:hypothetical protein
MTDNTMLPKLLDMMRQFEHKPDADQIPMLAFVRKMGLPPGLWVQLMSVAPRSMTHHPNTLYGIEVERNAVLPEHHALLHFGDGRMGLWDMRGTEVRIWLPGVQKL